MSELKVLGRSKKVDMQRIFEFFEKHYSHKEGMHRLIESKGKPEERYDRVKLYSEKGVSMEIHYSHGGLMIMTPRPEEDPTDHPLSALIRLENIKKIYYVEQTGGREHHFIFFEEERFIVKVFFSRVEVHPKHKPRTV